MISNGARSLRNIGTPGIEVRIEDPHLCDVVDGQSVPLGDLTDRLGRWAVVDAKGFVVVVADVRVHPRHTEIGVGRHDGGDGLHSVHIHRYVQPIREGTFYEVARHFWSPFPAGGSGFNGKVRRGANSHIGRCSLSWAYLFPILDTEANGLPSGVDAARDTELRQHR